jgi:hypothetical protein
MSTLLTLLDFADARSPQLAAGSALGADVEDGSGGPAVAADFKAGATVAALGAHIGPADDTVDPSPAVASDTAPTLGADIGPAEDGDPN